MLNTSLYDTALDAREVPDSGAASIPPDALDTAMAKVISTYIIDLKRVSLAICKNADLADDIVQQTCMKAWIARRTYDFSLPAKPWLFRILRNEYLQHCRRKHPVTNVDPIVFERPAQNINSASQLLDLMDLQKHMELLPDDQKQAVRLVVALGLTYEEAALACNCATGTIKSRVNRGKARLRTALGYDAPEDCTSYLRAS